MRPLTQIQQQIEQIYNLSHYPDVNKFLIKEEEGFPQEILLIQEKEGEVSVGLYIAPEILSHLEKQAPWNSLSHHNLEPFCTAVEGVSHFLFLLSRLESLRPVSLLEMELQAEIDKYLVCSLLLERQKRREERRQLRHALFERFAFLSHLTPLQKERYRMANRWAFQFCRRLERFLHPLYRPRLIGEARRFRQKGLQEKIHLLTTPFLQASFA